MSLPRLSLCTAALLLALSPLNAQSVTTAPVGAVNVEAGAESDTIFALTLVRPAAFTGSVGAKSGSTLTLAGAAFTASQFVYSAGVQSNTYYVQVLTGAAAGQFATVTANGTNSVTTEFESDILNSISVGDSVIIRPYWTLGTVFPSSTAGSSFVASTNNLAGGRRTEVLIPNVAGTGLNRVPAAVYFYNGFWRQTTAVGTNQNDTILLPDSFIIVRGNNYGTPTNLTLVGDVNTHAHTVPLLATATDRNDNLVGIPFPSDISLEDLNLVGNGGFVASTNNLAGGRGDELLVYDIAATGKNRVPSAVYFYNGFWRQTTAVGTNQNSTVIPAGSAIVIRKKAQPSPQVTDWKIDFASILAL